MAAGIFKGLAITLGSGLAFAAGLRFGRTSARRTQAGAGLDLAPLTQRVTSMEARIAQIASRPATLDPKLLDRTLGPLENRLAAQMHEVHGLRTQVRAMEDRGAEQLLKLTGRIQEIELRVPGQIEASVSARLQEMEQRLQQQFQEAHTRALQTLVQTIENTVLHRISVLEGTLAQQSQAIGGMREKSAQTDQSIQKLLQTLEKFYDQTTKAPAAPVLVAVPPAEQEATAEEAADLYESARLEARRWKKPVTHDFELAPLSRSASAVAAGAGEGAAIHRPGRLPLVFSLITIGVALVTKGLRQ